MKIIENEDKDIYGEYPCCWISQNAVFQKLQEFLFDHYQGYKFAIVFDCTKDELEAMDETPVYFLDTIFNEMVDYIGIDKATKWIEEKN